MAVPRLLPATNAKNIAFDRPGAGLEGYNITPQNIGAHYAKDFAARNTHEGGGQQLWEAISKNSARSLARSPNSLIGKQFAQFVEDGKWPDKPSPAFLRAAAVHLDYGYREIGRYQQHKQGFLDSFLGQLLTTVAEVAAGFIPVVGPYVSLAIGAATGYVKTHSVLGTVGGAISGYSAGSLGQFIGQGGIGQAWGALTTPANGAGVTAVGGGTGIANAATNVLTNAGGRGAIGAAASAIGTGVTAFAGGQAISKIPRLTSGPIPAPILTTADKETPENQAERIKTEAATKAAKAAVMDNRSARRSSWLAAGAHTGAGDPRNLGQQSPQARSGATPIATRTPSGRAPVIPLVRSNGPTPVRRAA